MLQSIDNDLWCVPNDVFLPGGVHFPGRMTVIRLSDGGLLLCSPVPIDDPLQAALEGLGPVRHVVAPNLFHDLFVKAAAERFPDATVHVAAGLPERLPGLRVDAILDGSAWPDDLDAVTIGGVPRLTETVLLHKASRTLVVTDLVFNLHAYRGWMTDVVLWAVGARKRLARSRSMRLMTRDAGAAAESARHILALDFDRLVMAHGDIVHTGGRDALAAALATMAEG